MMQPTDQMSTVGEGVSISLPSPSPPSENQASQSHPGPKTADPTLGRRRRLPKICCARHLYGLLCNSGPKPCLSPRLDTNTPTTVLSFWAHSPHRPQALPTLVQHSRVPPYGLTSPVWL